MDLPSLTILCSLHCTAADLLSIVNDLGNRIAGLGLVINVKKTVCMVFGPKPLLYDQVLEPYPE